MVLFTKRDRIAIACIALLVLIGWGIKFSLYLLEEPDKLRIIKGAVKLPAALDLSDTLNVEYHEKYSLIDINKADVGELGSLPMIGPVKAAAIVEYREKNGLFKKGSDIMKVHGIGPATYGKISKYINVKPDSGFKEK